MYREDASMAQNGPAELAVFIVVAVDGDRVRTSGIYGEPDYELEIACSAGDFTGEDHFTLAEAEAWFAQPGRYFGIHRHRLVPEVEVDGMNIKFKVTGEEDHISSASTPKPFAESFDEDEELV